MDGSRFARAALAATLAVGVVLSATGCGAASAAASRPLVVVSLGQSNAVGTNADWDPDADAPDPHVKVWGTNPEAAAYHELVPSSAAPGGMRSTATALDGLPASLGLANRIAEETGRDVIVVPAAVAGAGFRSWTAFPAAWDVDGVGGALNLAEQAISEVEAALAASGGELHALVWQQGETDAIAGMSSAEYTAELTALVARVQERIPGARDARWLFTSLIPESHARLPGAAAIDAALADMPAHVDGSAYVPIPPGHNASGDGLHLDASGARLVGALLADAAELASPET
ncbi:sialate O-acetylesterase [Microbacterium rhizophilus]|uniref:sialate O-acetylesterase n=1 Tax=Microbacterium rhizophilus TaxID=3138934 RepID=UPI0031E4EE3D